MTLPPSSTGCSTAKPLTEIDNVSRGTSTPGRWRETILQQIKAPLSRCHPYAGELTDATTSASAFLLCRRHCPSEADSRGRVHPPGLSFWTLQAGCSRGSTSQSRTCHWSHNRLTAMATGPQGTPDALPLIDIAQAWHQSQAQLRGAMTHSEGSYTVAGQETRAAFAERVRKAITDAAVAARASSPCPIVSRLDSHFTCSSPSGLYYGGCRTGVNVFFALVTTGLRSCRLRDIALSLLTTLIGHQYNKGWIMVDAGRMATVRPSTRPTTGQDCYPGE